MSAVRNLIAVAAVAACCALELRAEFIDGRVVQVTLPLEDAVVTYYEARGGLAMELRTEHAAVMGTRFFIGDGKIAVEMNAQGTQGLDLPEGAKELLQGFVFKPYSVVKVAPGYRRASELEPGDVYVILRGVNFETPEDRAARKRAAGKYDR